MTEEKTPSGATARAQDRSAVTYSRREALVTLIALPIGLAAGPSRAADTASYPVWAIERHGGLVYLLGHTPPRPRDWSDARIEGLLRTCSSLWNETNQTEHPDAQALMQRYGIDPNKPLFTWLSQSDRDRLSQAAKIAGVPENALEPFRPWLAGQALEGAFFGAPGVNGRNADSVLVSEAGELKLPVSSEFATKEEAARWFGDFSPVQEVQYLRYILDEILTGHDEGQRVYADWASGKESPAADWVGKMKSRYPELYRSIVVTRNQGWAPRIESMLSQKPAMVVVGLYHLVGADSIQAQLRASGLRVRRI